MQNSIVTNVDTSGVILSDAWHEDDVLVTVGADVTLLKGTIMARDSVSGKLVDFVKGGSTNENGIPKVVLTSDLVFPVAGDHGVRAMVSGKVRLEKLVIVADGDASNVDKAVADQLRNYNITAISVTELAQLDNQ